jgi:hypothetical protein
MKFKINVYQNNVNKNYIIEFQPENCSDYDIIIMYNLFMNFKKELSEHEITVHKIEENLENMHILD